MKQTSYSKNIVKTGKSRTTTISLQSGTITYFEFKGKPDNNRIEIDGKVVRHCASKFNENVETLGLCETLAAFFVLSEKINK